MNVAPADKSNYNRGVQGQVLDPIVPEAGERTFTYAASDMQASGCSTTAKGALFVLVSSAMFGFFLWSIQKAPETIHGPVWVFILFFAVFIAISVWVTWVGYGNWRSGVNAKLVLTPHGFRWYDGSGRLAVESTYDDIVSAEESVVTQPSRRYESIHHRLSIETTAGAFSIEDRLSSYDAISRLFIGRRKEVEASGVFRYRTYSAFPLAIFIFGVTIPLCVMSTQGYFRGEIMRVNGVLEKTPFYVPIFAIVVSSVFWALAIYALLNFFFERIEIADGTLRYYNLTGRLAVEVPLKFVQLNSFDQGASMLTRGAYVYEVDTTQGPIKWSDRIERCSTLTAILRNASRNGIG